MFSWHEDREITPGVPDMHYCFRSNFEALYRVGWLELKALKGNLTKSHRITVEPSQKQYIRQWLDYMPIHFLIRINERIYLIPGAYADSLGAVDTIRDLEIISVIHFPQKELISQLIPKLQVITKV